MTLSDFRPTSADCRVRGIGVAVSVRTWASPAMPRRLSLRAAPKRCSSSITTRPRSAKATPRPASAWVPTTRRIEPSARPWRTFLASAGGTRRESCATSIPKRAKRRAKVRRCWRTSTVVGATTATCLPASSAAAAARSATSVLPKPTSPQTRRSIGRAEARSASAPSTARAWSGVSGKPKPAPKRSISRSGGTRAGAFAFARSPAASSMARAARARPASVVSRRRAQVPPSSLSRVTASSSEP